MSLLVLWDIDHTLVDTRGVGRELWAEAFEEVTGQPMREQARIDGSTEPVILRETLELHGLEDSRDLFERFAQALGAAHVRRAAELRERGHALPGAPSVLSGLAVRDGIVQTVVTGNIRTAAEVKLAAFGLDPYMDLTLGAFGEDADERPGLVRIALGRAQMPAESAVLVGDTPSDVRGGLAAGVRVVAVATGRTPPDELRAAGAAEVVNDLADTERMLKLLTS
ncbi:MULTISPECIES: HAD family hydrolase [Streptomyces]|uniref:Phosphoglycolate phosphatase-like HAD superfamily hydrolase n=2 Tax=Streptomyces TaxID=1883 RepID=A0ABT9KN60_9ACTN|nr:MULTISPECIES: HAD hydrolase-like protein [Streptomyces]MCO8308247.1 HAD hydrolase-like protein [Streptomyces sp. RKCA744]MDP9609848.1 phosphoglycolate phosphatase-like HAD superfamily hydrolase [Streptomyces demainii]